MSWLIKTDEDKFEVWTEAEYASIKQKCEYYGSKPHWIEIRQIEEKSLNSSELQWDIFNDSKKANSA